MTPSRVARAHGMAHPASGLPKLYRPLRDLVYEVSVPQPVATRARASIERMLALA